jgi:hypothetical protein
MFGKPSRKDDAVDQLVGVLHFLDGFRAPFLGEILEAPVVEQAIVQPILIDRGQFVPERLVQEIDDLWIALHGATPVCCALMLAGLAIRPAGLV